MNRELIEHLRVTIKGAITNLWADAVLRERTHKDVNELCDLALKSLDPAWVSVEDRLPDDNFNEVFAYGNCPDTHTKYWAACGWAFHDAGWLKKYNVTHWAMIAAAPAEGKI